MGFKRYDGFMGSMPQKFIDDKLPKCPMCATNNPYWTLSHEIIFLTEFYLFKCSECSAILSVRMDDVVKLMKSSTPKLNFFRKLTSEKPQVYFKIKVAGNKQKTACYDGVEMTIDELAKLADSL